MAILASPIWRFVGLVRSESRNFRSMLMFRWGVPMNRLRLSRRQVIFGTAAATAMAVTDALCIEPKWLQVTEHDLPIAKLPRSLDGYRIAQVTDAHLRTIGTVEEKILRLIENRNVSLVLLTGDIIDDPARVGVLDEFCRHLQGPQRKILASLGNWEHWGGLPIRTLQETYRSYGIKLMINESEMIDSIISVAVTDDSVAGRFSLDKIMRTYTEAAVNLFITHSPGILDRIPATIGHFDIAFAGHTHGGQGRIGNFAPIRPPGSGRFISGWYDIPTGKAYISRGTGMSVLPARFACRPEMPIFTLRQG